MKTARIALLLVLLAAPRSGAQPLNDTEQSNEVKNRVALQNAKLDLALCAPELESLQKNGSPEAIAAAAQNPQCRAAILRARDAGMSGSQIIDTLMGASGDPDPNPGQPPGGGSGGGGN